MKATTTPQRMTRREVIDAFPEEWVLMELTDDARPKDPLDESGLVLCHSARRSTVERALRRRFQAGLSSPKSRLWVFEAILPITTGDEARRVLAELKAKGEPFGWRRW